MNIIAQNNYTKWLKTFGESLKKPKAILSISAHWVTPETFILDSRQPKTIHDFYGFPDELYQYQYKAQGAFPLIKSHIQELLDHQKIKVDSNWGLDHGTWAILQHLFPQADIPVTQLSLSQRLSMEDHYLLGKKLFELRQNGIMILCSGNLIHNLRTINWNEKAPVTDWALQLNQKIKELIIADNYKELISWVTHPHQLFQLAHPTIEHWLPLYYALGSKDQTEQAYILFDEIQNSTISMLSFGYGV